MTDTLRHIAVFPYAVERRMAHERTYGACMVYGMADVAVAMWDGISDHEEVHVDDGKALTSLRIDGQGFLSPCPYVQEGAVSESSVSESSARAMLSDVESYERVMAAAMGRMPVYLIRDPAGEDPVRRRAEPGARAFYRTHFYDEAVAKLRSNIGELVFSHRLFLRIREPTWRIDLKRTSDGAKEVSMSLDWNVSRLLTTNRPYPLARYRLDRKEQAAELGRRMADAMGGAFTPCTTVVHLPDDTPLSFTALDEWGYTLKLFSLVDGAHDLPLSQLRAYRDLVDAGERLAAGDATGCALAAAACDAFGGVGGSVASRLHQSLLALRLHAQDNPLIAHEAPAP